MNFRMPKKPSKLKNKWCTADGFKFQSLLEREYYYFLKGQKALGIIKDFELQPKYELQPSFKKYGKTVRAINYTPDFKIFYEFDEPILVDVKGKANDTAPMKRKMFDYKYPDEILMWVSFSKMDGGWIDYDVLKKKRKERKKAKAVKKCQG